MLSLLRLERKQKKHFKSISNSHISLSFLLVWNWNDKYVHTLPLFSRKPKADSRPKPKQCKNPTRWGGTYLYRSYKGVPPGHIPGVGRGVSLSAPLLSLGYWQPDKDDYDKADFDGSYFVKDFTVNPLLSPPGGLFISSPFEGGLIYFRKKRWHQFSIKN